MHFEDNVFFTIFMRQDNIAKQNFMNRRFLLTVFFLVVGGGFSLTAQDTVTKPSKSNMTVKEWRIDAATNTKRLDHVTTYNEIGKKIEEIEYDSRGQKWRKKYEHGPNGKVARELVYNSANKLDNIRKYEYDEFGRRKIEYIYDAKGRLKKYKVYEYIAGEESQIIRSD